MKRSWKEVMYMNCKIVTLTEKEGKDILHFEEFDGMNIELNETDQTNLRKLFYKIIESAMKEDFEFKLEYAENYNKVLYINVATEYIDQLNKELKKIMDDKPNLQ